MSERELHLGVSVIGVGSHGAAWRVRDKTAPSWSDVEHYCEVARIAERGTFDAVLLADSPSLLADPASGPPPFGLEPTLVLAAMARATERVGFIGTVSTTFNEPYDLARRFASLDHISGGRVALNAVTTLDPNVAANFGMRELPVHEVRYARAAEFLDVVIKLWDSWEDDAVVADAAAGVFADGSRIHAIDHEGEWFSVRGPLSLPRSPQGRPVLWQSGASEQGRDLAARYAEGVYAMQTTIPDAQEYYRDLKRRARRYGRAPGLPLVSPGLWFVVGGTEAEARARKAAMDALLDQSKAIHGLAGMLRTDVERLDLDSELPADVVREAMRVEQGSQGHVAAIVNLAQRERLTVRGLLDRGLGLFHLVVGAPEQIADDIERWFRAGAVDGFIVMADALPAGLEDFVDHVVPLLRRRGLFRHEYRGRTLREHLGLRRPQSTFADRRSAHALGAI